MSQPTNDWRLLHMIVLIPIIVAAAALGFILYRQWNDNRVPDWVNDSMTEFDKQTPPELRIVRTNPDGTTTDVTEDAIAGKVAGVNIGDKK